MIFGYGGTPFTYPWFNVVTFFLIMLFCAPCFMLAHASIFVFIVELIYWFWVNDG